MSRNKLSARILRQSARALPKFHGSRSHQRAECAQIRAAVFARRRRARLHAVVVRRLGFQPDSRRKALDSLFGSLTNSSRLSKILTASMANGLNEHQPFPARK